MFLVLGTLFGLLFLVVTPPFQVPDEAAHFFRAYQLSEGTLIAEKRGDRNGGFLPASLRDAAASFDRLPFHPEAKTSVRQIASAAGCRLDAGSRVFIEFPALAGPAAYAPQVLGMLLGRSFDLTVLQMMYLARALALLCWLLAVFVAVRLTPIGKWAFVAVSLLPMTVSLSPSISADSFTYALVALAVALALRFSLGDGDLSAGQLSMIVLVSLALCLTKTPYSLLFLVFLLVPRRKFDPRQRLGFIVGLVLCGSVVVLWNLLAARVYSPVRTELGVSPGLQLANMVRHPTAFGTAVVRTLLGSNAYAEIIGRLGWDDTPLPAVVIALGYLSLFLSFSVVENRLASARRAHKHLGLAIAAVFFMAIITSQYLIWNPVGRSTFVEGVQGRYFIPLLLAAIPLVAMRKSWLVDAPARVGLYLAAGQLVALTVSTYALFVRFF